MAMDAGALEDALDKIENEYLENEDDKAGTQTALDEVHRQVWGTPLAVDFRDQAIHICGGTYIPQVLWVELAQFNADPDTDKSNRERVFDTIRAFTESDFDDDLKNRFKPLIIVYIAMEKQFELDRVKSFIVDKAHPQVKEFFEKMIQFVSKNPASVLTYQRKFGMLKNHFPDFELFSQPLVRLEEELA